MGIVTASVSVSLDGCLAGPQQSREDPLGEGGERLHEWMFEHAEDHSVEVAAQTTASAYVMGRNMFGPPRGVPDEEWRGWWGEEPPYHAPVFVLTHRPREPLVMAGG
ncbi:dihydrofolate reductase family protein, partial [Ornithinicoccus halotolerans]